MVCVIIFFRESISGHIEGMGKPDKKDEKNLMQIKTLMILALLMVAGCRPTGLWFVEPEGPPEFQLGWQDGCDTGLSAQEKDTFYRLMYGYKKRPEMLDNDLYKHGWTEGFNYCRFSAAALQSN